MSTYQFMDHAAWMERNMAASRAIQKRDGRKILIPGPEQLSEFQKKVCDILGMVGGGIYNAPIALRTIEWDNGWHSVSLRWKQGMGTFDFNELTLLVFLCHTARVRCYLSPSGPGMLALTFSQRSHEGGFADRHPNLDEAVAAFKSYLPSDHRIIYREPPIEGEATLDLPRVRA